MSKATYLFRVDWENDGSFAEAEDDCTSDLISIEAFRGRDYASQLTGRASPGSLVATLDNRTGKYSSYYSSSPIYGYALPGRMVQLSTTAPDTKILWTGYLDRIIPAASVEGYPTVQLEASGALAKLSGAIYPEVQTSILSGALIEALLDTANWPAGQRALDTGQTTIDVFFKDIASTISDCREVEDTEMGFFYESEEAYVVFEDRHHRMKAPHTTSQATYSDAVGATYKYGDIIQEDPLQDIYNRILVNVNKFATAVSSSVLWTLPDETPVLAPGETKTFWAQYPNAATDPTTGAYVSSWDDPVVGVDITQTGVADPDIAVVVSKFAKSMKIAITNNNAVSAATLTLVQAQGTKVTKNESIRISAEDAASQGKYGIRSYTLPSEWLNDTSVAQDYTNFIISLYKEPIPILKISYCANVNDTILTEALTRNISDRITLVASGSKTKLGINRDFFIESIMHRIVMAGCRHDVSYTLSDAVASSGYWILGVSELDISTKLAY